MGTIEILNPTQVYRSAAAPLARRLDKLGGKTIGFLGNGKANSRVLLNNVEEFMREAGAVFESVRFDKEHSGVAVNLAALARCDAVITAIGD